MQCNERAYLTRPRNGDVTESYLTVIRSIFRFESRVRRAESGVRGGSVGGEPGAATIS